MTKVIWELQLTLIEVLYVDAKRYWFVGFM